MGLARHPQRQDRHRPVTTPVAAKMKSSTSTFSALLGSLFFLNCIACKKEAAFKHPENVDAGIEQLRAVLIDASPVVQSNLYNGVIYNRRYGKNLQAMMALDQIASDPSLKDQQKKLVNDLIEMLKPSVATQSTASAPTR